VVYGAGDDERGFMRFGKEMLHNNTKIEFGILHHECSEILKSFFKQLRK
jgi:tRNA(adenine34) deaminase